MIGAAFRVLPLLLVSIFAAIAAQPDAPPPPVAPQVPYMVKSPHGDRVDETHWLRDDDPQAKRPEILQYLEAENAYTAQVMAPLQALQTEVAAEMRSRIREDGDTPPVYERGWWYRNEFRPGAEYPVLMRQRGSPECPDRRAPGQVVLDPLPLAAGQACFNVGSTAVSPNGEILAWTEDTGGRCFVVAANARNKMVVIDVAQRKRVATIDTGLGPHAGRGANWFDPVHGWVNATPHMGEPKVSIHGADPEGRPDVAWRVVREITLPAAGSLFLKTHPHSPRVLFDMTLSATHSHQVCACSKADARIDRCFDVARDGKAVHFEFNQSGTQVWVSDWAADGSIVVLDGTTLQERARLGGLKTPTGKFNVYNTTHDVY